MTGPELEAAYGGLPGGDRVRPGGVDWRHTVWADGRVRAALEATVAAAEPAYDSEHDRTRDALHLALDVHLSPSATVRDLFRDGVEALVPRRERVAAAIYRAAWSMQANRTSWDELVAIAAHSPERYEPFRDVHDRCMAAADDVIAALGLE